MSCIKFISELSEFLELAQLETNYLDAQHDIAKHQNESELKTLDFKKMLFEYDIA